MNTLTTPDTSTGNSVIAQKDTALWDRYLEQKSNTNFLFPLEAAKQLKVSELELLLA